MNDDPNRVIDLTLSSASRQSRDTPSTSIEKSERCVRHR
jgi:hypothetical protein